MNSVDQSPPMRHLTLQSTSSRSVSVGIERGWKSSRTHLRSPRALRLLHSTFPTQCYSIFTHEYWRRATFFNHPISAKLGLNCVDIFSNKGLHSLACGYIIHTRVWNRISYPCLKQEISDGCYDEKRKAVGYETKRLCGDDNISVGWLLVSCSDANAQQ